MSHLPDAGLGIESKESIYRELHSAISTEIKTKQIIRLLEEEEDYIKYERSTDSVGLEYIHGPGSAAEFYSD